MNARYTSHIAAMSFGLRLTLVYTDVSTVNAIVVVVLVETNSNALFAGRRLAYVCNLAVAK